MRGCPVRMLSTNFLANEQLDVAGWTALLCAVCR